MCPGLYPNVQLGKEACGAPNGRDWRHLEDSGLHGFCKMWVRGRSGFTGMYAGPGYRWGHFHCPRAPKLCDRWLAEYLCECCCFEGSTNPYTLHCLTFPCVYTGFWRSTFVWGRLLVVGKVYQCACKFVSGEDTAACTVITSKPSLCWIGCLGTGRRRATKSTSIGAQWITSDSGLYCHPSWQVKWRKCRVWALPPQLNSHCLLQDQTQWKQRKKARLKTIDEKENSRSWGRENWNW